MIELTFVGALGDQIGGFFGSPFTRPDGSTGVVAATSMEPEQARQAFPCFDEPALKATFNVTLVADAGLTCLSNMDVAAVEDMSSSGEKKKVVRFHRTPVMSTYLVAFAVIELSFIENTEARIPIRVYVPPEYDIEQGRHAGDELARALDFYEELFRVPYALPTMDLLMLPAYAGAMENWGLIIGAGPNIAYDPGTEGISKKQLSAEIVWHELAHQWFGNLVTLEWWDQTWLNEGG